MENFPIAQYAATISIGMVSSTLSILGSSVICVVTTKRLRHGDSAPIMQRLLFCLGIMDIIASISWMSSEFLVPSMMGRPWTMGNLTSCTFSAVLHVYGSTGASMCNLALSVYFLKSVRMGKQGRNPNTEKFAERGWFALIILLPLCLVIYGFVARSFGIIANGGCWAGGSYPFGCDDIEIICIRGPVNPFFSFIVVFTILGCLVGSFVYTVLIWRSYRRMIRRCRRYSFPPQPQQTANDLLLKEVSSQSICFFLAYFNMFIGFFMASVISYVDIKNLFPLVFIGYFLMPLQGFLNCIVYMRPAYRRWKNWDPKLSMFRLVLLCIQGRIPGINNNTSNVSRAAQVGGGSSTMKALSKLPSRQQSFSSLPSLMLGSEEGTQKGLFNDAHEEGDFQGLGADIDYEHQKKTIAAAPPAITTVIEMENYQGGRHLRGETLSSNPSANEILDDTQSSVRKSTDRVLPALIPPEGGDLETSQQCVEGSSSNNAFHTDQNEEETNSLEITTQFPRRSLFRRLSSSMSVELSVLEEVQQEGDNHLSSEEIVFETLDTIIDVSGRTQNEVTFPQQRPRHEDEQEGRGRGNDQFAPNNQQHGSLRFEWFNQSLSSLRLPWDSSRTFDVPASAINDNEDISNILHSSLQHARLELEEEYGTAFNSGFF